MDNTNIVPPDTSGGPAVYSGWLGGNGGNQYGCQVTFTAKTVTPTLNGFAFTLHCVSADQVPNPPYSYNPTAKTCDLYFPTPSAVGFYVQAMANLLGNDDSVAFVLSYSPERSGPLYSQPVVCVQTLRSGEDTWYTLSESANNFLYGFSSGESDTLKKGTPVSLYAFQGWGGTPTGTAGWADDGNGNSLTWQSATADEQWNSWGFIVVEDNSGNTASGPLAQMRSGGQDEPAHMVEIHLRSDQTTAFSSIWNAINAATNGDWATVSNSGTFDPAVFGMSGDWFMGGANNAIPPDDEPRLYRTDPNGNWTDQNTTRQHSDGSLNANCLGLIAQDVAARAEALVQIGGTIELDSTAWANVLVSYIARQFCPMPGPGGGGYWASERTNPVGELDPGKLYMTYVSLTYWGNVQSVGNAGFNNWHAEGRCAGRRYGRQPDKYCPVLRSSGPRTFADETAASPRIRSLLAMTTEPKRYAEPGLAVGCPVVVNGSFYGRARQDGSRPVAGIVVSLAGACVVRNDGIVRLDDWTAVTGTAKLINRRGVLPGNPAQER